MTVEIMFNTST